MFLFSHLRLPVAAFLVGLLYACTPDNTELPAPTIAVAEAEISVAQAQTWYQTTYAAPATTSSSASARGSSGANNALDRLAWQRALTTGSADQKIVLVPLSSASDQTLFAGRRWQGARYLVVAKNAGKALEGNVVELLVPRTNAPLDTAGLVATLYRNYKAGRTAAPNQAESYAFFYSADYRYLAGKHFRNGQVQGNARLKFLPTGTARSAQKAPYLPSYSRANTPVLNLIAGGGACTDWYNANTGEYITTTGDCSVTFDDPTPPSIPPDPTYNGGGYNPGDSLPDYGGGNPSGGDSGAPGTTMLGITMGSLRPCAGQIVTDVQNVANNNIINGGPIANLIRALSINPNISITFNEKGNLLNEDKEVSRAQTTHTLGSNIYNITLNSDFLSGEEGSTDLAIGGNIIHELLHVYMGVWADEHGQDPNARLDFLMYLYFERNGDEAQHEAMTSMVGYMGEALLQYYNSRPRLRNIDKSYCEDLIWGTLPNSPTYKLRAAKDPAWATRVVAYTEAENSPNKAGAKVGIIVLDPKGTKPCQ
jgi:hypothetical protein